MSIRQSKEYLELLRAHGCAYCGMSIHEITVDHVLPKAGGGTDALGNLVPACYRCNQMKGSLGVMEFLVQCRRVAKNSKLMWTLTSNRAYWNLEAKVKSLASGDPPPIP